MRPIVVYDQPDEQYRDVDAAHYSGLKVILDCPARFRWNEDNRVEKRSYDFGHAVHAITLGAGSELEIIEHDTYHPKAAREQRDAAYAAGLVPVLRAEYDRAQQCADAVHAHPLAGLMLSEPGHAETSVYWVDEDTEIPCKARIDWIKVTDEGTDDETHWLIDLKTSSQSVAPAVWGVTAGKYGYHIQGDFYPTGYSIAMGIPFERIQWVNVNVETTEPFLVSVTQFTAEDLNLGRQRWGEALEKLKRCNETDEWPGYNEDGEASLVYLPAFATR